MKRVAMIMVALVCAGLLVGCGGGSSDSDSASGGSVTLSVATLAGNYVLTGFTFILANGQVLTENDARSWSGSGVFRADSSFSLTQEIDGAILVAGGTFEILNASTMRVVQTMPFAQTYDMAVMFDGQTFTASATQDGETVTKSWRKQ